MHGDLELVLDHVESKPGCKTLQLGDYAWNLWALDHLDPKDHKFIHGNHDILSDKVLERINKVGRDKLKGKTVTKKANEYPHYLGPYGIWNGIFYVSGARSYDLEAKKALGVWDEEEEISETLHDDVLSLYYATTPDIVVTHDCPIEICQKLHAGSDIVVSQTSMLFSNMFKLHEPKCWIFGHHHIRASIKLGKTTFQCLALQESIEIEV